MGTRKVKQPMVELLRSKYDGKTLAICVAGYRHGPDLGPWYVVAQWPLDDRLHLREDKP